MADVVSFWADSSSEISKSFKVRIVLPNIRITHMWSPIFFPQRNTSLGNYLEPRLLRSENFQQSRNELGKLGNPPHD